MCCCDPAAVPELLEQGHCQQIHYLFTPLLLGKLPELS